MAHLDKQATTRTVSLAWLLASGSGRRRPGKPPAVMAKPVEGPGLWSWLEEPLTGPGLEQGKSASPLRLVTCWAEFGTSDSLLSLTVWGSASFSAGPLGILLMW